MAQITFNRFDDVHEAFCHPGLRQSLYDAGDQIMNSVLLTLHGEAHKTRRHLELRLFQRNYAHHYETTVFPATLSRFLSPLAESGQADLVDFGYRVTMNLTADFAGIDRPQGTDAETAALLSIVKTFSEGATVVHTDRNPETVMAEVRDAMQDFKAFLEPSWRRRQNLIDRYVRGEITEDELPRDVLTVLLRNQDRVELTEDIIEREIAFYLQAGSHSTANQMVHAIHEILCWSDQPGKLLDNPLLLQRCVHESMRLHPASPVAWRTPTEDTSFTNGTQLTPDDLLILDLQAANRDPEVFGDQADRFNPLRKVRHRRAELYGLTFGTGVHMCTGRDLDGGVAAKPDTNPETHQYGIVGKLIEALLQRGMKKDPDRPPVRDAHTTRNNWGYYPVVLSQ